MVSQASPGRRTLRLDLEYDGSGFVGWQAQARGRTVQGTLETALRALLQEEVTPVGSGRTDAGTHALGQVAHAHVRSSLEAGRIHRGLNALLPEDVAVLQVRDVAAGFHARYSALAKRYRYRIDTERHALGRHAVWTLPRRLDLEPMAAAAAGLRGTIDFRAFCKADPPPEGYSCRIDAAEWRRAGHRWTFEIEADRFLRHMVRALVGTLVEVGQGRRSPRQFLDLLQGADRSLAGATAPARGLCLLRVRYPEELGGASGPEPLETPPAL